jgi:hypothetical protein
MCSDALCGSVLLASRETLRNCPRFRHPREGGDPDRDFGQAMEIQASSTLGVWVPAFAGMTEFRVALVIRFKRSSESCETIGNNAYCVIHR